MDLAFKADMRILHDRVSQHHNVEIEVGTVEAAEEDSGDVKFNRDRSKRRIQELPDDELFTKQSWIRDSWNPPVTQKPRLT
ncbi:hypothetical protein G6F70_008984 [Rhizopus microsporus]|nr:hypothetical protein G6F71_008942 [Rhizopus microsporus]KAG1193897.1 hypothetical protein G6F70_008984 [Rhizopus microsporus]KAG1206261.1 hypothetical protein G6F69_008961 [Rhizopus microsporus]KAG1226513.1 hypothetical protein G6F67_008948 [Rhizopus microsporus]KAG1258060.1 hypothetical protein G6F68_008978 [Rhizopus microsporus]